MNQRGALFFILLLLFSEVGFVRTLDQPQMARGGPSRAALLARCLTDHGWVLYTSFTCPACRAQRQAFGEAYDEIDRVECHPHAPDSQYSRCAARGIDLTPTWVQEADGKELQRIEGFQRLDALASRTACPF